MLDNNKSNEKHIPKYKLQDLIDIEHFQNLQNRLNEIYSFPSAIVDNEGTILTAVAWQDICTQFHRKNKSTLKHCIKSDQYILSHLHEAKPAVSYRCPHGLVDNAAPIIIDGIHYGNFFTGQFFLEKPDMELFRTQARKYGFDEDEYLKAVKKVPIWTQQQLDNYLYFINGLISVIAESGLKSLNEIAARKHIEESEVRANAILQTAMDGFWLVDKQGCLLQVNESYCRMSGYSEQELLTMRIPDLEVIETDSDTAAHIKKIIEHGQDRFESKHRRKDGSAFNVEVSTQYRDTEGGQLVVFLRDITESKHAEEQITTQKYYLEKAQELGKIGTWELDVTNNKLYWTDENCRIFGVPAGTIVEYDIFIEKVHPDDRDYVNSEWMAALDNKPYDIEHRLLLDGITKWVREKADIEFDEEGAAVKAIGFTQDITYRKQAEAALNEGENKYIELFENMAQGAFYQLADGKIVDCNSVVLEMFGLTRDQFLGKTSIDPRWNVINEDGSVLTGKNHPSIVALKTGKEVIDVIAGIFNPRKNKYVWVSINAIPQFKKDENKAYQVFVTLHDITKRKNAEEELRGVERKSLALLENSPVCTKIVDLDLNLQYMSASGITGLNIDDITQYYGKPYPFDFYPESFRKLMTENLIKARETGEIVTQEGSVNDINGNEIWFHSTLVPVKDDQGLVEYIIVVSMDTTDRKQAENSFRASEERIRQIIDVIPHFIFARDENGTFILANKATAEALGTSPEKIVGKSLYDLCKDEEYVHKVLNVDKDIIGSGETYNEREQDFTDNKGVKRSYFVKKIPFKIYGFERKAVLGLSIDITERKKLEEQLAQSQKMEAIGQLAGGIAHDFNNIVQAISLNTELSALAVPPDSPLKESLAEIKASTDRAADLIRQLLAFSRRQIIDPKIVSLNDIINVMKIMLGRLIGENIEVLTCLTDDLWTINVDKGQIEQVVTNLAVNARDAMPDKGKLTIETANAVVDEEYAHTHMGVTPGEYVMLSVSDTGIGMDEKTQAQVFEPFFTTKGVGKGTGLGLSTCYGIVKQNNGNIWVYSEPGIGTTFKMYFPRVEKDPAANNVKVSESTESPGGNETILLVEDEVSVLKAKSKILRLKGYTVYTASNGVEALPVVVKYGNAIDLMITDVVMPEMGGKELADKIYENYPEIKVLFMSGYTDDSIGHHGVLNDDVAFLSKPASMLALLKKVRQVLEE